MTTLQARHALRLVRALWLALVGVGSGIFNSPNTAAMMGVVPMHRRGIAAGARMMLPNTGAVHLDRLRHGRHHRSRPEGRPLQASSPASPPGSPREQLDPFISNMHTALWVLAGVSLLGAGISMLRPGARHEKSNAPTSLEVVA